MTHWYDTPSVNNIESIGEEILGFLSGHKYTFVEVYEYKRFKPETRLHQKLENGTNGSPLSSYISEDG